MTAHTIAEAFADAAARLTDGIDTTGDLVALLSDCTALLEMASAGLLVDVPGEGLALLSSTSHATDVLELYELQNGRGPCIQAVRDNTIISAADVELKSAWEPVGPAIVSAGYLAVHAFPLRSHNQAVGALNLFATHSRPLDDDQLRLGQAFANMAVALLSHTQPASWEHVHQRVLALLSDRVTIEQAKGVLAVQHDISLADAYTTLVTSAHEQHLPLPDLAAQILASTRISTP
jgi:GAF domain-containing protein